MSTVIDGRVISRPRALDTVARVVGVPALLAAVVFGAARPELSMTAPTRAPAESGADTGGGWVTGLSWALVTAGALAFVALVAWRRRRRRREPEPPPWQAIPLVTPLQRAVALALVVLMFAVLGVIVWWLVTSGPGSGGAAPAERVGGPASLTPPAPVAAGGEGERTAWLVVGGIAVASAVALGAALAWRRWARGPAPAPSVPALAAVSGDGPVRGAVRSAPCDPDDPDAGDREAIVACYAELERWLAERGAARDDADTASEHVRRAVAGRLAPPAPVRELLGLFQRARFGHHPVTPGDRRAARRALAEVAGVAEDPGTSS